MSVTCVYNCLHVTYHCINVFTVILKNIYSACHHKCWCACWQAIIPGCDVSSLEYADNKRVQQPVSARHNKEGLPRDCNKLRREHPPPDSPAQNALPLAHSPHGPELITLTYY